MSNLRAADRHPLSSYLASARKLILEDLARVVPADSRHTAGLYELALNYPMREGKALRPALCIAICRALGGELHAVVRTASVLELFHNAFLIHDDIEDESELRRNLPTLHELHGRAIAVNVGDGMLALCMDLLLENGVEVLGVGRALRTLQNITKMARETAEGQMMELRWIRRRTGLPGAAEYIRMVYKKTAWYSFIAPMTLGAIAAGRDHELRAAIHRFGALLGIAFQIRDDVLNLIGSEREYGKEIAGDLWEGKLTLMLIHTLSRATAIEQARAKEILSRPRLRSPSFAEFAEALRESALHSTLTAAQRAEVTSLLNKCSRPPKSEEDVAWLRELIHRYDGVRYADSIATRHALRAEQLFERLSRQWSMSAHRDFVGNLVSYVATRNT